MLPSIRHLLDTDPAAGNIKNTSTPQSPPNVMPATAHHQKITGQKQNNVIAIGDPHQQRNTPQYRENQHQPHPPYEQLHPLHPHPHERGYERESIPITYKAGPDSAPFALQTQLATHYSQTNGFSKDNDPHYPPPCPGSSISDADLIRKSSRSLSPHTSPRSPFYADGSGDPRRGPRAAGSLVASESSSRSNFHAQIAPPPPQSVSSTYRSQQRASPFDPSISSSASSASPSPSISAASAVSSTTDAISTVTKGTAAATINESRSRYGVSQVGSRIIMRGEYKESPVDRHSISMDYSERTDRSYSESTHPPYGGLVQAASRNPSNSSPPFNRSGHQDALTSHQHPPRHSSPSYFEESSAKRNSTRKQSQSPGSRHSRADQGEHQSPYAALHRPQEPYGSEGRPQRYPPSSGVSFSRLDGQTHISSSSSSPLRSHFSVMHNPQQSTTSSHTSSPGSPSQRPMPVPRGMFERERDMVREWPAEYRSDDQRHAESELAPFLQGHGRTNETLSSPSPAGTHNPHSPHRPVDSSFPSQPIMASHSPRQQSRLALQQQQHPPSLHDPVCESDHTRFQRPASRVSVHPSRQTPPPGHESFHISQGQQYITVNAASSAPLELPHLLHQGFQQQGLASRPERMPSQSPLHPYYTPQYAPRPFLSQPSDADLQYPRMNEEERAPTRGPVSHQHPHPHPHLPHTQSAMSQMRLPGDGMHGHVHHTSQGYSSVEGRRGKYDHGSERIHETMDGHNGNWSDGSPGHDRRGNDLIKGSDESPSQPLSVSVPHWRDSQQYNIRLSVSESDLQAIESARKRERHIADYPEEDVDEDEGEDLDEGEEVEEGEGGEEIDEEEEDKDHVQMRASQAHPQHRHHPHLYEFDRYGPSRQGEGVPPSGQHGTPPRPQHYTQPSSYDGPSMNQHPREYWRQQHPQDQPSHPSQHPHSYPPHSYQHPRMHLHSGQYVQQHQHADPAMEHFQSSTSGSTDHHMSTPRQPNRRGPYLSRQRALLAGLETTTPSSRYHCQFCNKRFSRPSSLRIHTYSHTGERPFKCSEEGCGRQFSVQSNMRRHLRVHRLGRMRNEFPPRE